MSENRSKTTTSSSSTAVSKPVSLQGTSGVTIAGNDAPVTITDGGAIKGSIDLAGQTVQTAAQLTMDLVGKQAQAGKDALAAAQQGASLGYQFAMQAGQPTATAIADTQKMIMVVAGIMALAFVMRGGGK